jgi:hypothetical protein
MRSRGFNQAELIARAAQRGISQAIGRRLTIDLTTLLRVRFAESQVALTAEQRRQQIRGAFKVTSGDRIKGREILLVDDVLTTGATAAECARELRIAGAARVWVATPARALWWVERDSLADLESVESGAVPLAVASPARFSQSSWSLSAPSTPDQLTPDPSSSNTVPGTLPRRRGISLTNGEQPVGRHASRARLF